MMAAPHEIHTCLDTFRKYTDFCAQFLHKNIEIQIIKITESFYNPLRTPWKKYFIIIWLVHTLMKRQNTVLIAIIDK